jgi:hypothetical protein
MIDPKTVTDLHRTMVRRWHQQEIDNLYEGFSHLVCEQHKRNFLLWHEEDVARSTNVSDREIANVKRAIDRLNQQRNDHIERLDDHLIAQLSEERVTPQAKAPINSETPGSIIDRLSIMALRMYHMREQTERDDVDEVHREKARHKLTVCAEQYKDLSNSLAELLDDIFAGRKRLKVYHQFKMYNDPTLNPYLYGAIEKPAA